MASTVNQATFFKASVDPPLLEAQRASLTREERIDTLDLTAINGKVPSIDIADRLMSAKVTLTIEGASTLELGIHDPDWEIEASGLLDKDRNGRLDAVGCKLDSLRWRLAKAGRNGGHTLTLTFEDEVWALLRAHRKHIASSRGSMTRAQFIERLVREIRIRRVPYYSPEKGRDQPKELPELPEAAPPAHSTGFDKDTKFKIKGVTADADQMRNVATAMRVADQEDASPRARLAMLVAGIGESGFRDIPNAAGSPYGGVFQALKTRHMSTTEQARAFLKGGRGFQAGGAIALARENPSMSVGTIATKVEASGQPGSFYDAHHDEGAKIADAWNGGSSDGGASTHEAVRVKSYRFTRGLPGQPENSAQAATRLADEVEWRFFVAGGVVWFVTDHFLISRKADLSLTGIDAAGLIDRPSYEWDHRKLAANVSLQVAANAWAVRPGAVVVCHDMGPVTGRWIVETFEFDLFDPVAASIALIQPVKPKKEPAPEIFTVTVDSSGRTVHDDGIDTAPDASGKGLYPPVLGVSNTSNGYSSFHDGMDLICPANATLYACCRARVIDARSGGWWGKNPTGDISKGDGIIQLEALEDAGPLKKGMHVGYGHAEHPRVKAGDTVKPGDVIGEAGFANAWHVHFMINGGGTTSGTGDRDPRPYWQAMDARKGSGARS